MTWPTRGQTNSLRPKSSIASGLFPALTLLSCACSGGAMESSPRLDDSDVEPLRKATSETDVLSESPNASEAYLVGCADEDVRECLFYLPEHNGVRPCIVGFQVCSDNTWGQCVEGVPLDGGTPLQPDGSF